MKKTIVLFSLLTALGLTACNDATRAQFSALGMRHRITLYGCDGKVIGQWISTGNVSNQVNSDDWYFEDEKTHRFVEVNGTLVIEVIPN